ncbi:MAG: isochorismatase family cysteine hydrolase [Pseudomonadota bacterium]
MYPDGNQNYEYTGKDLKRGEQIKPAIIIVDMLKGGVGNNPILKPEVDRIVPSIQRLLKEGRGLNIPIIFACDSFLHDDFLFRGKMKPHSIRGTNGVEVIDELKPEKGDMVLEKRRFSAFFRTDLDMTLRTIGVDTIVVCGMSTHVCVILTGMDGVANDFNVVILEDCCAAGRKEIHDNAVKLYRRSPIYPLFRIMTLDEFLPEVKKG